MAEDTIPPGANAIKWKPLSFTLVEYPEGDIIGLAFAASALVPVLVAVALATCFFVRRDLHTLFLSAGVIANYAVNLALKSAIGEQRPEVSSDRHHFNSYGMPSTHAQYMAFVAFYQLLFVCLRLPHAGSGILELAWKAAWVNANVALAAVVIVGRVYLSYHTVEQVAWGVAAGCGFALVWFAAMKFIFTPMFPYLASLRVCEFFLVRDLTYVPHVAWFEYENARKEAKKRTPTQTKAKRR